MPLLAWFADLLDARPQFYRARQETMDAGTSAIDYPTQTQAIPTLSFDLDAPAGSSSGWTVRNVHGDGPGDDFVRQFQDILNRAETFSILNALLYRHVLALLVVVWSLALWWKLSAAGTGFGRWDGLAGVLCVASVLGGDVVLAVGVAAGYAAWVVLADRPWDGKGGLPGFEAFVQGLKPAGEDHDHDHDQDQAGCEEEAGRTAQAEPGAEAEAALLTTIEARLGLPEKKPSHECVVCWSSDDSPPLRLPCSHLVCADCLGRLKDASRYTCPFCRRPLYTLSTNKAALFQLVAASSGAQLALACILAALRIARGRYWGAAECLVFKGYPAAVALWHQWGVRTQGEEGVLASTSERSLQIQLGLSVFMLEGIYRGLDEVGWATFIDGKLVRASVDEWRDLREVVCWAVPGLAGKVLSC